MDQVIDRDLRILVLKYLREKKSKAAKTFEEEVTNITGSDPEYPKVDHARLHVLMSHAVSWQVWSSCKPRENPEVKTLLYDIGRTEYEEFQSFLERDSEIYKKISKAEEVNSMMIENTMMGAVKISCLKYMKCNYCLLAMTLSGVHYVWRWENDARAEFPPRLPPALWEPFVGRKMAHQNTDEISEPGGSCFALYADESTLISMAPGAGLSRFDTNTCKRGEHIYKPHPAPTIIAIHPMNNDIIAVGMDDSTIFIFENSVLNEILEGGHTERVSGLAFSNLLDVLVSSGKDSQLCVWGSKDWMKKDSRCLHLPHDDTSLHFYIDQLQFLVVHPKQLAVYAAKNLKELHKRDTMEFAVAPMTDATFSADGNFIYACFKDGSVCIYTSAYLVLHCNIASSAYQIDNISSSSSSTTVYPAVIAVHPEKAQLALGMTDGSIYVLEPLKGNHWVV